MRRIGYIVLVFCALLFVGACHPKSGEAKAKALASSTPNAQAKAKVEADINKCINPITTLLSRSGRQKAQTCLDKEFTPAQKQKLENCLVTAAEKDHVFTSNGRTKFESQSVGYCASLVA